MYKKPLRQSSSRKERSGKVHPLTKDQIIREYGMKEVGKLSNKEQVLLALKQHTTTDPKSTLSIREAIEKTGILFNQSSHSAAMVVIWKTLGTDKGGMGLFNRVKKGSRYTYYKETQTVDKYLLENFKNLQAPKTKKAKKPATEAAATAAPAPGTLNVNLKVTWDINLNLNGLKGLFN